MQNGVSFFRDLGVLYRGDNDPPSYYAKNIPIGAEKKDLELRLEEAKEQPLDKDAEKNLPVFPDDNHLFANSVREFGRFPGRQPVLNCVGQW